MNAEESRTLARKLVDAAKQHTEDTGEPHWLGDMDQVLTAALERMPEDQKESFLQDDRVTEVLQNLEPQ
jgi:hypothetical protein